MYFLLYIFVSIISVWLGFGVYKKLNYSRSGLFFLLFTFFGAGWFILYFIFFSNLISDKDSLLFISRITFSFSILALYSFLFFIFYFNRNIHERNSLYSIISIFLGIILLYTFTNGIINDLDFSITDGVYREIYGTFYKFTLLFYVIFLGFFLYLSASRLKLLTNLNRIRLKRILYAVYFMIFMIILLQVFLPLFDIWIFENQIILFYLFFVVQVYYTLNRYYFDSSWLGTGKSLVYIIAFSIAILTHISISIYFPDGMNLGAFWDFPHSGEILNVTMSIGLFVFIQKFLTKYVIGNENKESIREHIFSLQNQIVSILDINTLNKILFEGLNKIFLLKHAHIYVFGKDKKTSKFLCLKKYFEKSSYKIYIHDIVFWEEKSDYPYMEGVKNDIAEGTFLVLPLLFNGECLGIFTIGSKNFNDAYTREEIRILENFSRFLSAHVRYLAIYDDLQDLTLNLDKKVDEKTIDYNNLINRQKEFIAMISHEVRSPMSAAIFQGESLIEELDKSDFSKEKFKENLRMLSAQLIRMGGIISKLFSVQYYENNSVNLFRERVQFVQFLEYEIDLFAHVHDDVTIISDIDKEIGFLKIDKIQFQQVLNNLLDNAIKFISSEDPIISVQAHKHEQGVEISIEDNGRGFEGINIDKLFDIYTTGANKNIGLGMGLYLCKKIVSMHSGTIKASISKSYGGACFTIFLPILSKR